MTTYLIFIFKFYATATTTDEFYEHYFCQNNT